VLLREGGGSDVSGERSDVPRTDAEDVSHWRRIGAPKRPGWGQAALK
jgi:hypothetical protein